MLRRVFLFRLLMLCLLVNISQCHFCSRCLMVDVLILVMYLWICYQLVCSFGGFRSGDDDK